MRILALALLSACALAACNPSGSAGNGGGDGAFPTLGDGADFRAEITATNDDGEGIPMVMIRSGQKQRLEFASDDGQMVVVSDGSEGGESWVLMTSSRGTMAFRGLNQGQQYTDYVTEWQNEAGMNMTRSGDCSVAGESGSEWTGQDEEGTKTVCVTSDGILLRGTENGQTRWEATDVQRGAQASSLFELPPGVQFTDISSMMPQGNPEMEAAIRDAMEKAKAGQR